MRLLRSLQNNLFAKVSHLRKKRNILYMCHGCATALITGKFLPPLDSDIEACYTGSCPDGVEFPHITPCSHVRERPALRLASFNMVAEKPVAVNRRLRAFSFSPPPAPAGGASLKGGVCWRLLLGKALACGWRQLCACGRGDPPSKVLWSAHRLWRLRFVPLPLVAQFPAHRAFAGAAGAGGVSPGAFCAGRRKRSRRSTPLGAPVPWRCRPRLAAAARPGWRLLLCWRLRRGRVCRPQRPRPAPPAGGKCAALLSQAAASVKDAARRWCGVPSLTDAPACEVQQIRATPSFWRCPFLMICDTPQGLIQKLDHSPCHKVGKLLTVNGGALAPCEVAQSV